MSSSPSQRRNAKRHRALLLCGSGDDPRLFGRCRDLSTSGAFVEWVVQPPLDSVVEVGFAWHDDVWRCRAKVVRHGRDGVGLEFIDPGAEMRRAIEEALAEKD